MFKHPTRHEPYPKSINILALGPTNSDYHTANFSYDPVVPRSDQTWTVNKGFRTQRTELVFILDDLEGERRISETYWQDILKLDVPVITSIIDPGIRQAFPGVNLIEYPIQELIDFYGRKFIQAESRHHLENDLSSDALTPEKIRAAGKEIAGYLTNSIPMMLAYAGFVGVHKINLFGADYDYPGAAIHEADKPCCEYWIGVLRGVLGVRFKMSARTTLLCTNTGRPIYGYGKRQPMF